MKTPDYLSYDRYKNKKRTNPKRRFFLFIGTFIVSLFAFLLMAQIMAPEVDVTIGDDAEMEEKNIGLGVKQFVDNRLRSIDLDDLGKNSLHKSYDDSEKEYEEEKIVIPNKKEQEEEKAPVPAAAKPQHQEEPAVMPAYEAPRPDANEFANIKTAEVKQSMVKVYVGKYSNATQAKVALDILMDSGLNVSPFVKNLNGTYTLQIGSFSDKNRATEIAKELTRNGFPARLVQE